MFAYIKITLVLTCMSTLLIFVGAVDLDDYIPKRISDILEDTFENYAIIQKHITDILWEVLENGAEMVGIVGKISETKSTSIQGKRLKVESGGSKEDWIMSKKRDMVSRIHYVAFVSVIAAVIPIPGPDIAVDIIVIVEEAYFYKQQFGLLDESIRVTSTAILGYIFNVVAKMFVIGILKYISPVIGIFAHLVMSYILCHYTLESVLEISVQDALEIS